MGLSARPCADGRRLPARVVLAVVVALGAFVVVSARDVSAQVGIPGLADGCYEYDAGATGMYRSLVSSPTSFNLEVEGDVVQAAVEWAGIWTPDPASTTIGVSIAGPGGTRADSAVAGALSSRDPSELPGQPSFSHGYFAEITDLFDDGGPGTYTVTLTPPDIGQPGENVWWGATATVVYDTGPCAEPAKVIRTTGSDFYFGGAGAPNPTTGTIVYDWGFPLPSDYTATILMSHGGAQHDTTSCRVSSLWVASGAGAGPGVSDPLVSIDGVPDPEWGAVEGIVNPFTPPMQVCAPPQLTFPVVAFEGGDVGPQWALIRYDVRLPAGSTWAAFQLESPRDGGGGTGAPESGAFTGGLLLVPTPEPDVSLEKTVKRGDDVDACPGVDGTDELVIGEVGDSVVYCFRVLNTGLTHLFPITVDDPDLGVDQDDMALISGDSTVPLAPDGAIVYGYVTTLTSDHVNTATVTAVPSDDSGDPLDGFDLATDADTAEVRVLTIDAVLTAFCDNDTPWLDYDLSVSPDVTATTATITFSGNGGSAAYTVAIGDGQLLWPGAQIDGAGDPIAWPGWSADENGVWFLDPAHPYAWAHGNVQVVVEANPSFGPVTLTYPPATADCDPAPQQLVPDSTTSTSTSTTTTTSTTTPTTTASTVTSTVQPAPPPSTPLPATGSNAFVRLLVAGSMVLAGTVLVVIVRDGRRGRRAI